MAGCLWTVEVRAGLCRLLWILLLSNQDSRTVLDTEPRADSGSTSKVINYDTLFHKLPRRYRSKNRKTN